MGGWKDGFPQFNLKEFHPFDQIMITVSELTHYLKYEHLDRLLNKLYTSGYILKE